MSLEQPQLGLHAPTQVAPLPVPQRGWAILQQLFGPIERMIRQGLLSGQDLREVPILAQPSLLIERLSELHLRLDEAEISGVAGHGSEPNPAALGPRAYVARALRLGGAVCATRRHGLEDRRGEG